MKSLILLSAVFLSLGLSACRDMPAVNAAGSRLACSDDCRAKNQTAEFVCSLTTPELQERKATVLARLKEQVLEKKELADGFAFRFAGTDEILDQLLEFIKSERECCKFFVFNLSISGDKSEVWLELTGVDGVKEVIADELGL